MRVAMVGSRGIGATSGPLAAAGTTWRSWRAVVTLMPSAAQA